MDLIWHFNEPIFFRKNQNQKAHLIAIGIDDDGLQMLPALGEDIKKHIAGEILTDPNGVNYKISKINLQSNLIWLEVC